MKNTRYYPLERNRYFYGKLLTVRDFETEQKYFNDKHRLINRLLHGGGVVCGLQVVAVDDKTVSVEPGMALDYLGREIIVASPVTLKLSMVEGFSNNEYAKNVYLCLAYEEKEKEPVYSVATSTGRADEVSEYNRIQESYRLFIREDPPPVNTFAMQEVFESSALLYQDDQVRIWQKIPRYVNPGEEFDYILKVEKTLQTARLVVDFTAETKNLEPAAGEGRIIFREPDEGQETEYTLRVPFKAGDAPGETGEFTVKDGAMRLEIGDKLLEINTDCCSTLEIIPGSVKKRLLNDYADRTLEQALDYAPEQCVYLAKINLLRMGPTYMIEKVEPVPFNEYLYNATFLHRLDEYLEKNERRAFSARAEAKSLGSTEKPYLRVDYDPDMQEFAFELGIPPGVTVGHNVRTGLVELAPDQEGKTGKSKGKSLFLRPGKPFFSEEIEHGLGSGAVCIVLGLEGVNQDSLSEIVEKREQLYYGSYEIFKGSEHEADIPQISTGAIVYPQKGTFRIGARIEDGAEVSKVLVRWWAFRQAE